MIKKKGRANKRDRRTVAARVFAVIAAAAMALTMVPAAVYADSGVSVDGDYGEWGDFPHTLVEYNTWDEYPDSYSAVYSDGDYVYLNVYSEMPAHLAEAGGEFSSGISVQYNDDWSTTFYPRFIAVDDSGNINWEPQLTGLSEGTYHFYLCSTDAWHTSTNISDLNDTDLIYGEAYMTISDGRDEMEYKIDSSMVAEKFGMDTDDFKTVGVQYSRLGQQWTRTAGTSTGEWIGVGICVISIILLVNYSRKKNKKK
jgi:hypothetical protein